MAMTKLGVATTRLISALGVALFLVACSPAQERGPSPYNAAEDEERSEANQQALQHRLRYTQIDR